MLAHNLIEIIIPAFLISQIFTNLLQLLYCIEVSDKLYFLILVIL